jgi:hypothetical protein
VLRLAIEVIETIEGALERMSEGDLSLKEGICGMRKVEDRSEESEKRAEESKESLELMSKGLALVGE